MFKNPFHVLPKELARTTLCNGSALRVIKISENSRCCEIYIYGKWKPLDEDWAKEALLTYGRKAQRFILKHVPEILEKNIKD